MTPTNPHRLNVPSLQDLMLRYIEQKSVADEGEVLNLTGEVELHSATSTIPVEPRTAWQEAQVALNVSRGSKIATPPEWANWVFAAGQVTAIPFAAGNFPQDVQDLASLVESQPLSRLRPNGVARGPVSRATQQWVDQRVKSGQFLELLLAIGVLRRAGDFAQAAEVLKQAQATAPVEQRGLLANEEGALLWHQGRAEDALRAWESADDSVPTLFNRGMALLFLDRATEARPLLRKAAEKLPESSAWHHLAGLYAALAEMRG